MWSLEEMGVFFRDSVYRPAPGAINLGQTPETQAIWRK